MGRSFLNRYFAFSILAVALLASSQAQNTAPSCNEIHVYASVLNQNKQVVGGLLPQDFSAQLNGKPAVVKDVKHDNSQHRVTILIDHSSSMESVWPAVVAGSFEMLSQLPTEIPISVIFFDKEIRELTVFNGDRGATVAAVKRFFDANPLGRRTRLYDAIDVAMSHAAPNRAGDLIYLITDAGDNDSYRGELTRNRLARSGTRLFAIIFPWENPSTSEERYGPQEIHDLVQQTGGTYLDWNVYRNESLNKKAKSEINIGTSWLIQNMLDDYDLTLDPGQQLFTRAKVKLDVKLPGLKDPKDNRFRVITQPTVATGCQAGG